MSLVVQMMKDLGGERSEQQSSESPVLLASDPDQAISRELPLFAAADELQKQERRLILGRNMLFLVVAFAVITFFIPWDSNYLPWSDYRYKNFNIDPVTQISLSDDVVIDKQLVNEQVKTESIVALKKEQLSEPVSTLQSEKTISAENAIQLSMLDNTEIGSTQEGTSEVVEKEITQLQAFASSPQPVINKITQKDKTIDVPAVYVVQPDISHAKKTGSANELMTKVLSLESQDQSLVLEARSLVDSNFVDSALSLLERRTAEDTSLVESAALYAMLLTARQQYEKADTVISKYRKLQPQHSGFIKSHIRLYIAKDQFEQALHLIDQYALPAHIDRDFLILRAAIYQEQHSWLQSIEAYQKLLSLDNEHARSWLGLAIALDAQGELENARGAYQRAIDIGELEVHLHNYALSRVATL